MSLGLQISGQPVRKQNYTRVPMVDLLGHRYSAFVHHNRVRYRPIGGSQENRTLRAEFLAEEFGGEVQYRTMADGYVTVTAVVDL